MYFSLLVNTFELNLRELYKHVENIDHSKPDVEANIFSADLPTPNYATLLQLHNRWMCLPFLVYHFDFSHTMRSVTHLQPDVFELSRNQSKWTEATLGKIEKTSQISWVALAWRSPNGKMTLSPPSLPLLPSPSLLLSLSPFHSTVIECGAWPGSLCS